ncbi:hypothetical protein QAD02_002011 [Eretmocerus hayati]|uniref:Uncharacterized protein n=1 Tax=Eretmocerus hayati TaxID=131215 RepID=A0ACC2NKK1_9HYME|nr:hypothetical protein QAD02_002011 [Eretmocerus hayati]
MAANDGGLPPNPFVLTPEVTRTSTYASAISAEARPRKEQAIIIESIEDLTNDDYLDGLGKLIDLEKVRFISKVSGGRVSIFLGNDAVAESLINQRIDIKAYRLKIKPYIEENKRVIISNVNPIIPNDLILRVLKEKNISPVSSKTSI